MKAALVLFSALSAIVVAAADEKYTSKYDNIDLDAVLRNDRLLQSYAQCLLDAGEDRCTADGKELKRILPDALSNECAKCNDKQKEGARKVLKHLINHKEDIWRQLKAKYDPDGAYSRKYEARERELHE